MTTEVAVLNKLAVALAADSAATIDTGQKRKIYNTANKIFDLSESQPLGLMVYGNLEFMGYPFELVVKEFRRIKTAQPFTTVADCMTAFRTFLETELTISQAAKDELVASLIRVGLFRLSMDLERSVLPQWAQRGAGDVAGLFVLINDFISGRLEELRALPPAPCFENQDAPALGAAFEATISAAASTYFRAPADEATLHLVREYSAELLYRETLSPIKSGVVIAGFGRDELCPSLRCCEVDGVIGDRLKSRPGPSVELSTSSVGAEIIAFAQDDIAELFLTGLLPAEEQYIVTFVSKQLEKIGDVVREVFGGDGEGAAEKQAAISTALQGLASDLRAQLDSRKNKSRSRVLEMVRFMPVQELIVLAESLIEITSLKRRVTDDLETVGGAVDVAAITRSEGLVWIKRKHYFDPDLNSRFFVRQRQHIVDQGTEPGGEADAQDA